MIRVRLPFALPLALLASLTLTQTARAQGSGAGSVQKQAGDAQSSGTAAQGGLKRRDLKGQAMSQQAEPEGLTPEQKKMYEEIQQQLQQIKENKAKSDAALQELMKGDGR
jgi:hypothetical protein